MAPPRGPVARRPVAGALGAAIVGVCVMATVGSHRYASPQFPVPFAPSSAIAYDAGGRAVAVPSPQDRVLLYVSERCAYCRDELSSWEALMRQRGASQGPTIVLAPGSTTVEPSWLPRPFRSGWIHDREGAVAKALGIRGVPFTAVVGRDGIIQEAWTGTNPHARRDRLLTLLTDAVGARP